MPKELNVSFLGDNIERMLKEITTEIFNDKALAKKNSIINEGLKAAAQSILPSVWNNMRHKKGIMRMFTGLKRVRKGVGWSIASPTRDELAVGYPKAKNAKGYYPMSMEYGFKSKKSRKKIEGNHAMKRALEDNRDEAINESRTYISNKLENEMRKYLTARAKVGLA